MLKLRNLIAALFVCASSLMPGARGQETTDTTRAEKTTSTYKEQVVVERTVTTREIQQVTRKKKERYTCAIFVANRSEKVDDQKVLVMQDFLTGYATDKGFNVIAREDVINSVKNYATEGPNRGNDEAPGAKLDELLSNNTSALRLAQNMSADYILVVTITSYGTNKKRYVDPAQNIDLLSITDQMKTTYRLLDGTLGGSTTAGVAAASKTSRIDPRRNAEENQTMVDDLIDATAMDMADMLGKAASNDVIAVAKTDKKDAEFEVYCSVADMVTPEIIKNDKGEYIVMAGRYRLESLSVSVELDGVMIGTTNQKLKAKPGLHKLRLRRNLFNDYEATVMISDGLQLQVAMEMSPEGIQMFGDMTRFLNGLKKDQILTDAQARMWEGYARQMEENNMRMSNPDDRRTITVDPEPNQNRNPDPNRDADPNRNPDPTRDADGARRIAD